MRAIGRGDTGVISRLILNARGRLILLRVVLSIVMKGQVRCIFMRRKQALLHGCPVQRRRQRFRLHNIWRTIPDL